jgi:hypothetical protein
MKRSKYISYISEGESEKMNDFLGEWIKLDVKPQKLVAQLTEDGSDF